MKYLLFTLVLLVGCERRDQAERRQLEVQKHLANCKAVCVAGVASVETEYGNFKCQCKN